MTGETLRRRENRGLSYLVGRAGRDAYAAVSRHAGKSAEEAAAAENGVSVATFCAGERHDDMTLIVAKREQGLYLRSSLMESSTLAADARIYADRTNGR